jgi:hypothetical protein
MKLFNKYHLGDVLAIVAVVIILIVFSVHDAKAKQGDQVVYTTEQYFSTCRSDHPIAMQICATYILAVWDTLATNKFMCMNPEYNSRMKIAALTADIVQMIRHTSGLPDEESTANLIYRLLEVQGAYEICPEYQRGVLQ